MKTKLLGLVAAAALVAVSFSAQADLIVENTYTLENPLTNPEAELEFVETELDLNDLVYLDKYGVGDTPPWDGGGAIAGSEYFQVTIDGSTGTVSWDLTGSGFELRAVLVKDGVIVDEGHLYNLFSVTPEQWLKSGPEDIFFGASLEDNIDKDISHVTFFGVRAMAVPAPATLLLLGTGLLVLGLVRRRHGLAQTG